MCYIVRVAQGGSIDKNAYIHVECTVVHTHCAHTVSRAGYGSERSPRQSYVYPGTRRGFRGLQVSGIWQTGIGTGNLCEASNCGAVQKYRCVTSTGTLKAAKAETKRPMHRASKPKTATQSTGVGLTGTLF